jgi:hypothetical protein
MAFNQQYGDTTSQTHQTANTSTTKTVPDCLGKETQGGMPAESSRLWQHNSSRVW